MSAQPKPAPSARRCTPVQRVGPLSANEAWFREINEQIETHALKLGSDRARFDFVCECADMDCAERLPLTLAEYEHVRAHPARFAVKPGHAQPELEHVVEHDSFWTVEKTGPAAGIVGSRDA